MGRKCRPLSVLSLVGEPFWWEGSETLPLSLRLVGKVGLVEDIGLHVL